MPICTFDREKVGQYGKRASSAVCGDGVPNERGIFITRNGEDRYNFQQEQVLPEKKRYSLFETVDANPFTGHAFGQEEVRRNLY